MGWKNNAVVMMRADLENKHLLGAIKMIDSNGGRVEESEIRAEVGDEPVDELLSRRVASKDRFGGKNWIENQANINVWKRP